jgi:hypothetical protein
MSNELVDDAAAASDTLERMNMQFSATVNSAIASQADELIALADALARVAEWAIKAGGNLSTFFDAVSRTLSDRQRQPVTEQQYDNEMRDITDAIGDYGGRAFRGGRSATNLGRLRSFLGQPRLDDLLAQSGGDSTTEQFSQLALDALIARRDELALQRRELGRSPASSSASPPARTGLDTSDAETTTAREIEAARAREAAYNQAWLQRYNQRIALQRIEIENELELARLRGDEDEVRRLERELELQERINALVGNGVAFRDAQRAASGQLDAADAARQQGEYREFFRSAFKDGMLAALDGNAGEALSAWWRDYVTRAMSGVLDRLADSVFDAIANGMSNSGGGLLSSVGSLFGGFFAHGGTMAPGQYGYAGEAGMERVQALKGGGVKITPIGGVGAAGGHVTNVIVNQSFPMSSPVLTSDLLEEMNARALAARNDAVATSRGDMGRMIRHNQKSLRR